MSGTNRLALLLSALSLTALAGCTHHDVTSGSKGGPGGSTPSSGPGGVAQVAGDVKITHCHRTTGGLGAATVRFTNHTKVPSRYIVTVTFAAKHSQASALGNGRAKTGVVPAGRTVRRAVQSKKTTTGTVVCTLGAVQRSRAG